MSHVAYTTDANEAATLLFQIASKRPTAPQEEIDSAIAFVGRQWGPAGVLAEQTSTVERVVGVYLRALASDPQFSTFQVLEPANLKCAQVAVLFRSSFVSVFVFASESGCTAVGPSGFPLPITEGAVTSNGDTASAPSIRQDFSPPEVSTRSKRPSDEAIAREFFELFMRAGIRFAVAHVKASSTPRQANALAPAVADYAMSTASAEVSRKYGLSRNEMIEIIGIAMDGLDSHSCTLPDAVAEPLPPRRPERGDLPSSAKPVEAKHVQAIAGTKRIATQQTRLGPILGRSAQFVRSATEHGCHFAYVAILSNGRRAVVFDGQPGTEYDAVGSVLLSPDSGRLAYVAAIGTRQFVVVDDRPGPGHVAVFDLKFSPDGRRVAYVAGSAKKQFVVVDGQAGPEFDGIAQSSLNFSANSKRFGYVAGRDNKFLVVVDDQLGPAYESIGEGGLTFSPDGNRVAYAAKAREKWMVVVDGDPGPEYDGILKGSLVFSRDGMRLAYGAQLHSTWRVVLDGHAGPEYQTIGKDSLGFSPDSRRLRYVVRTENKWLAVVDGSVSPPYDMIGAGDPVFSTDGRRVAYAAKNANTWTVVVDGEVGPEHDDILEGTPRFSPGGDRLAYGARRMSKWTVVVDGQAGAEFESLLAGTPVFSPNGKRVAYGGRRTNTWVAVVDGQLGLQYDGIGIPVFSADSQHVVYVAARTGNQLVVVDERAGPQHEGVVCGPVFRADGVAEWIARNDGSLYRVTCCTDSPCEPCAPREAPAEQAAIGAPGSVGSRMLKAELMSRSVSTSPTSIASVPKRTAGLSSDKISDMTKWAKCRACGGTILHSTAESYDGHCVDCYKRLRKKEQ